MLKEAVEMLSRLISKALSFRLTRDLTVITTMDDHSQLQWICSYTLHNLMNSNYSVA